MDRGRVAVAHLVPVVTRQLHLGSAVQSDLAARDQIVEASVRTALQCQEVQQLRVGGLVGDPLVDAGQPVLGGQTSDRAHRVGFSRRTRRGTATVELLQPGLLKRQLHGSHCRVTCPARPVQHLRGVRSRAQGGGAEVVDREQAEEPVRPVCSSGVLKRRPGGRRGREFAVEDVEQPVVKVVRHGWGSVRVPTSELTPTADAPWLGIRILLGLPGCSKRKR